VGGIVHSFEKVVGEAVPGSGKVESDMVFDCESCKFPTESLLFRVDMVGVEPHDALTAATASRRPRGVRER
jgi:hypothetical protein